MTSDLSNLCRLFGFLVWFGCVLAGLLLGQRSPDPRLARTSDWLMLAGVVVVLALLVVALGRLGAPPQAQVGLAVALLGVLVWRLGESWLSSAVANAGILVLGCGLAGLLLAFSPLRGWTGFIAGVLGGAVLLVQGLRSGLRGR